MARRPHVLLLVAVLVAIVGVLVAIVQPGDLGGDGDDAEQALTDDVVLRLADLPADQGWREREVDEDAATVEVDAVPEGCEPLAAVLVGDDDARLAGETASSESPSLERGDLGADAVEPPVLVNALASAFVDPVAAQQPLTLLRDPGAGQCIVSTVEQSFNADVASGEGGPPLTLTDPTVEALPGAGLGEDSLLLRLAGSFGVPAVIELPFRFDLHVVRVGRFVVGVAMFSLNAPPPDDLAVGLLQPMLNRVP